MDSANADQREEQRQQSADSAESAERIDGAPLAAGGAAEPLGEAFEPNLAGVLAAMRRQSELTAQGFQALRGDLDMFWERLKDLAGELGLEPKKEKKPRTAAEPQFDSQPRADLEPVVFGRDLAPGEELSSDRQELLAGLAHGDGAAMMLVGQILIFRAAAVDRMPTLLKDLGESYYRWRPLASDGADPMRDALIHWLQAKCDAAGVPNTIELVRPGDRYEPTRHNAKERGVEVADVFGWVVLRDNGKVYTKANVSVK